VPFKFLDIETIIALHDHELSKTPHEPTHLLSYQRPESASNAPKNAYYYLGQPDAPTLAAKYVWHIVMDHPFMAGNKRAGMAASIAFLAINGYDWLLDGDEYGEVINRAIAREVGFEDLVNFLRAHSRKARR
jgi:death on curing protein